MINKKNLLFFFISLIVISITVSAVSATDVNTDITTDAQSIETTEVQKVVDDTQTIDTINKNNDIGKIVNKDVKTDASASSYFVSTTGKATNQGTESSPYDLITAVNKVKSEKGGSITLNGGTYKIDKVLSINTQGNYNIIGKQGQSVTIDAQNKDRIFYIAGSVNVNLKNIIFTNGKSTGIAGAIFEDGTAKVTVDGCTFNSNTALMGGAIYARGASLTVQNSKFNQNKGTQSTGAIFTSVANSVISKNTFTSNTGVESSGAIQINGANIKVTDNTFTSNSAKYAGAITNKDTTKATIENNYFTKNLAIAGAGGAIYNNNAKQSTIANNVFVENGNQKTTAGGAIDVITTSSDITISNNNFTNNKASDTSGAIYTAGTNIIIKDNKFTQNSAERTGGAVFDEGKGVQVLNNEFTKNSIEKDGGALYIRGLNARVENNKFDSNVATRSGAALLIDNDAATVKSNTFTNNVANNVAGAIGIENAKNIVITDNTFSNNKATNGGGAIYNNNGTTVISNNKFDKNSASQNGGAIAGSESKKLTISNNVFTENSANNGGAISNSASSTNEVIKQNVFTNNKATNNGGVIYNNAPGTIITENNFTSNAATKSLGGAISNYGNNVQITKNNFIANSANYNGNAIRDIGQSTKTNNKNVDTSKCSATIFNKGTGVTISNNVFEDNLPVVKVDSVITVSPVKGVDLDTITFTATVKDAKGNNINGGNLVFKVNQKTITGTNGQAKVSVKNGVAQLIAAALKGYNNGKITASYSGSNAYNPNTSKNNAIVTVTPRSAKATVSLSTTKAKQYDTITITVKLSDVTPNTKITTPEDNSRAFVLLKINGKTFKNSKNEVIKIPVKNGVGTFKYTVPKGMAGYDNTSPRYYTITACYSHPDYTLTSCDSAKFTVERSAVSFDTTKVLVNKTSNKLVIQGNIKDFKGNNVVGVNKISVKINGKTLNIDGKNVKTINNGVINLVIDLPTGINNIKDIMLVTGERNSYNSCRTTITNFTVA